MKSLHQFWVLGHRMDVELDCRVSDSWDLFACLLVCLVGFLTSSSTTRLYRRRVPRLTSLNRTRCHTRDKGGEIMTSVSVDHFILTPTQPVGIGRPQQESNSVPPHQESRALPTPGEEVPGSIPAVAAHFLLVGSVSV